MQFVNTEGEQIAFSSASVKPMLGQLSSLVEEMCCCDKRSGEEQVGFSDSLQFYMSLT